MTDLSIGNDNEIQPAPDFTATDHLNRTISLNDSIGKVTIIHVTQMEIPMCLDCEEAMKAQLTELIVLADSNTDNITIITLNIRKYPNSDPGWMIVKEKYDMDISWHWIEDFEPYPIAGQYQKYWEYENSFANPSIIFIDTELNIVGDYKVHSLAAGELDGVQSAESLISDIKEIMAGEWNEYRGEQSTGVTFVGMFLLGILTSFSPCSIALLIAMVSYIGSMKRNQDDETKVLDNWKTGLGIGLAFTFGMAIIFLFIGFLISYIGVFIELSTIFYLIAGIILIILGINAIKPLSEVLYKLRVLRDSGDSKSQSETLGGRLIDKISKRSVYLASFFLGILFSVGWAPCALSLVFPVVVLIISGGFSVLTGGLLMFVFGIGHGLIIIPFCTATGEMKGRIGNKYVAAGKKLQLVFGFIIIAIGAIFALRFFGLNLW